MTPLRRRRQGQPVSTAAIAPDTRLGLVHLTIGDLTRALSFYLGALGLKLHRQEGATAWLGVGGPDLVVLTEIPGATRPVRATGLYHFAILVPTRLELARALRRLAESRTPVQGFADHIVSEAIYLADPDGNGIEIYRDRPRSDWYDAAGDFLLDTKPLDLDGIMAELRDAPAPAPHFTPDTVIGHVHLHVRDIREAERFWCGVLGFELMMDVGSALFVAAGGYHHHLGLNTWGTQRAAPPPPGSVGLRHFVAHLPDQAALDAVLSRVQTAGVAIEPHPAGSLVRDPAGNAIVLTSP